MYIKYRYVQVHVNLTMAALACIFFTFFFSILNLFEPGRPTTPVQIGIFLFATGALLSSLALGFRLLTKKKT